MYCRFSSIRKHTSLGEESAESLIRISSLAFFGQVSIGLFRDQVRKGLRDQMA